MARIVVIDDDCDSRSILRRLLEHRGHEVVCVGCPLQALSQLEQADPFPELLLLDYMMPEMSGLAFLQALRSDPRTSELPVILHTATDDPQVARTAKNLGAADVWLKASLGIEEMHSQINLLLS